MLLPSGEPKCYLVTLRRPEGLEEAGGAGVLFSVTVYDHHVEHRGVRSKLKTHAQPYHGGDGCKAELGC